MHMSSKATDIMFVRSSSVHVQFVIDSFGADGKKIVQAANI